MAYASTTFTTQDSLITALGSWLTGLTTPWTQDDLDTVNDEASFSVASAAGGVIGVDFEWNGTDIGIHQHLGYAAAAPGANTDDSGNGGLTSNDRRINGVGDAGTRTYHFFHIDSSPERYAHCVIEYAAGIYRHFGMGELIKLGGADWVGGEYAYAQYWDGAVGNIDTPLGAHSGILLDCIDSNSARAATLHAEGLQNMDVASKWLVVGNMSSFSTDTAGENRYNAYGNVRSGPYLTQFALFAPSTATGLFPMCPNHVFHEDRVPAIKRWRHIGTQPDVRILNMKNFQAGETVTIGGNDWMIFPVTRKQRLELNTEESWNMGIAYRKT